MYSILHFTLPDLIVHTQYILQYRMNKRVLISDPVTKCIFHKQLYTKMILNPVQLTSSLDNKSRSHSLSKSFRASYNTLKCTGFFPSLTCWAKALQRSATIWSSVKSPKNNIRFRKLFFHVSFFKKKVDLQMHFFEKIYCKKCFHGFFARCLALNVKMCFFSSASTLHTSIS